jgi:hypothetical protein
VVTIPPVPKKSSGVGVFLEKTSILSKKSGKKPKQPPVLPGILTFNHGPHGQTPAAGWKIPIPARVVRGCFEFGITDFH